MRSLTTALLLGALVTATWAVERTLTPVTGNAADFGLPQALAMRADKAPVIDGRADDTIWSRAREGTFVHAVTGGRAPVETTFRLAWDEKHLYVFLRAVERGQESFAIGPATGPDPRVHTGDAVEVFLQPHGSGTPYYQVAANPWGGYMTYRWAEGEIEVWRPDDVVLAGQVNFDDWTLEMAIPFSAMGETAPAQGDTWRANFCRNEQPGHLLYGAWSSTGDGFQVPARFGHLVFAGRQGVGGGAGPSTSTVTGRVLTTSGAAAVDMPVRAFGRVERTDSTGVFRFDDVMQGSQVFSVISPAHEPFHGRLEVNAPQIELAPVTVVRTDPFRPRWTLETSGVVWLRSSLEEPPVMTGAPPADRLEELQMIATPGEYESRAVAFYTGRGIEEPSVRLRLETPGVGTIPAANIEVRWTQRQLKRLTYQTTKDHAEFVWRFLWREPPAKIAAGQVRQLVVTVKVPDRAPPGVYRGELVLSGSERGTVARLPVALYVPAFRLVSPKGKRVGTYINGFSAYPDEWVERLLVDVYEHGGRKVKWWMQLGITERDGRLEPEVDEIRQDLLLLKRLGFEPPYTVGTSAEAIARRLGVPGNQHAYDAEQLRTRDDYQQTYRRFVRAARDLETEMGIGPFTLFWSDEIFQEGRLEPWLVTAAITREETDQRIYITHHSGDREKINRIDPYTDIRCYHGRRLDDDYTSAAAYDSLRAELTAAGDTAWAYYNVVRTDITPEFSRLVNGYWMWRTPVSVHVPWTYYYGDLDSMEGVREGLREAPYFAFAAPHPSKPEVVSTLDWECFREGWDDHRYLATLERAIEMAPPGRAAQVKRARDVLATWWAQDPRVTTRAAAMDGPKYQQRRELMTVLIEDLTKGGGER